MSGHKNAITKAIDEVYSAGISDESIGNVFNAIQKGKFMYDPSASRWFCLDEYGIWKEESEQFHSGELSSEPPSKMQSLKIMLSD
jgi:hypothetical protein